MFTLIRWDSPIYRETLALRNQVLKASAGKPFLTKSVVEEKHDIHLVIKIEDRVVGTLLLHPCDSNCIQIKQVALSPDVQGQGLGKKLIVYAEQVARNLNYATIFLTGRKQAWGFYEKLGYVSLMDAYQEDELLLKVFKKRMVDIRHFTNQRELKTNG